MRLLFIIGLCGGSGSGKGAVSSCLASLGIPSIDTDKVYHELTSASSPCLDELRSEFGDAVIENGALSRKALADIVFSSDGGKERLVRLNTIAHKHILDKVRELISEFEKKGIKTVVVDAPLLFESGFDKECDLTLAVIAEREVRISRIMARDNITYEEARRRIDSQASDKWLSENADRVIENNGDIASLCARVRMLIKEISK